MGDLGATTADTAVTGWRWWRLCRHWQCWLRCWMWLWYNSSSSSSSSSRAEWHSRPTVHQWRLCSSDRRAQASVTSLEGAPRAPFSTSDARDMLPYCEAIIASLWRNILYSQLYKCRPVTEQKVRKPCGASSHCRPRYMALAHKIACHSGRRKVLLRTHLLPV